MPVEGHAARRLPPKAGLSPHARACRRETEPPRARSLLLRAEARGTPAPLRLPPGARRRAAQLGRAEGAELRSEREAARRPRRGPSARVRHVRGLHPGRRVRRGQRATVGSRRVDPARGSARGLREGQAQVRARRREAPRRVDARAHGRAIGRGRQELAPLEGARRRGPPARRRRHPGRAAGERRGWPVGRRRARGEAARASFTAARDAHERRAGGTRVAARAQIRRLPRALPHRARKGAALLAQRQGVDARDGRRRARRRSAAGRRRMARRRSRRPAAGRAHELPGAPERPLVERRRRPHVRRVRRALSRRP